MYYFAIIAATVWLSFLMVVLFAAIYSRLSVIFKILGDFSNIKIAHLHMTLDIAEDVHKRNEEYEKCAQVKEIRKILEETAERITNNFSPKQ